MLILEENHNALKNFVPYENEKFILEEEDIKKNHKNLVKDSLDI